MSTLLDHYPMSTSVSLNVMVADPDVAGYGHILISPMSLWTHFQTEIRLTRNPNL